MRIAIDPGESHVPRRLLPGPAPCRPAALLEPALGMYRRVTAQP